MDRAPGCTPCAGQSHEFLCSFQTGADRGCSDNQTVRRGPLGRTARYKSNTDRSFVNAARFPARPLDAFAAVTRWRCLEAYLSPSGHGTNDAGEVACPVRMAWTAPRRPHHGTPQAEILVTGGDCTHDSQSLARPYQA